MIEDGPLRFLLIVTFSRLLKDTKNEMHSLPLFARFSDYHAPQLQNTSFFDPVMYGIVTLQFCPVLLTETIGRINRNHAHRTVRVRFNPFAPEPPRTARADPRPFYPL